MSERNLVRKDDRVTRDRTTDVRDRRVETRVDLSASELWVESDLFEQSRLGRQIPQSSVAGDGEANECGRCCERTESLVKS